MVNNKPSHNSLKHWYQIVFALDDEESQPFFDTEEVFQQLNYECIGNADYDSDSNENEVIIL